MNPLQHLNRSRLFPAWFPAWLPVALGAALPAQAPHAPVAAPTARAAADEASARFAAHLREAGPATTIDRVLLDEPGDGRLWALGTSYKASFGADGFVYVPFFGSDAPRVWPLRFVLRAVRVGGDELAFASEPTARVEGSRVTLDRGAVREHYDLAADRVEQTFVIDTAVAGEVELELELLTELGEDGARDGLQFGNHLGSVEYGTAWLVHGDEKREIGTEWSGSTLRMRVPAGERRPGPIVIDPVIRTHSLTPTAMRSEMPDVAYDETTDRWAVVWSHIFAETDHDVVAELRAGDGSAVAGSYRVIDTTTDSHSWARVANLASADRFLVAMERYLPQNQPGQQFTVRGRTMNAAFPFTTSQMLEISPASTADQRSVDVGGDPGNGSNWMVVWVHGSDIHGRLVDANGVPAAQTIPIENNAAVCINPQISLSNGNGLTPNPRWVVVYMREKSGSDWDIYGSVLHVGGTVAIQHEWIAVAASNDLYTYVSSPVTDTGGAQGPYFMVSFERQGSTPEMIVKVVDRHLSTVVPEVNLTRRYGMSGVYCRVESDGLRFAATSRIGNALRVLTLAMLQNDLVLHEPLQTVLSNGHSPHIASKRSGGGSNTDYAVVYVSASSTPTRIGLAVYEGRTAGQSFDWRLTGCDGLRVSATGRSAIGETIQFGLDGVGSDHAGLLLGLPAPAVLFCASCSIGIDPAGFIVQFPAPMSLTLPQEPALVGLAFAVQGFAIGSGSCAPAWLRLSDTVDFQVH